MDGGIMLGAKFELRLGNDSTNSSRARSDHRTYGPAKQSIIKAGWEALFQAGKVSIWEEGGTAGIHFPRRERGPPSPA